MKPAFGSVFGNQTFVFKIIHATNSLLEHKCGILPGGRLELYSNGPILFYTGNKERIDVVLKNVYITSPWLVWLRELSAGL